MINCVIRSGVIFLSHAVACCKAIGDTYLIEPRLTEVLEIYNIISCPTKNAIELLNTKIF